MSYSPIPVIYDFFLIDDSTRIIRIYLRLEDSFSSEHSNEKMVFPFGKHDSLIDHQ